MRNPLTGPERLRLKATAARWHMARQPADARQLADAFAALMDDRDRLAEQMGRVEALRDRWEATVRDPTRYRNGGAEHAAALAASHLPDLRRALDGPGSAPRMVKAAAHAPGAEDPTRCRTCESYILPDGIGWRHALGPTDHTPEPALDGTEADTPPADLDAEEIDLTTAVCDVLSDIEDGTLTAEAGIAALREFLAGRQDAEDDGDDGPDMANPTPALRQAVTDALFADSGRTPEQQVLLSAYLAVICGDCQDGRCHWGGQASKDSIAAAEAGREYHQRCGCDRHEVSVRWRAPAGQEPAP